MFISPPSRREQARLLSRDVPGRPAGPGVRGERPGEEPGGSGPGGGHGGEDGDVGPGLDYELHLHGALHHLQRARGALAHTQTAPLRRGFHPALFSLVKQDFSWRSKGG